MVPTAGVVGAGCNSDSDACNSSSSFAASAVTVDITEELQVPTDITKEIGMHSRSGLSRVHHFEDRWPQTQEAARLGRFMV